MASGNKSTHPVAANMLDGVQGENTPRTNYKIAKLKISLELQPREAIVLLECRRACTSAPAKVLRPMHLSGSGEASVDGCLLAASSRV